MSLLFQYLKKHIRKETQIETKDGRVIKGVIAEIDKELNLTVVNASEENNRSPQLAIRGSNVRSFLL